MPFAAWLEPRGLGDVLAHIGFDWHETGLAIERLRDQRWIVSPVIGFATARAPGSLHRSPGRRR